MQTSARLTIAIQKKGRLSDESIACLKRCDLKFPSLPATYVYSAENTPIDLLLVRDDDIPLLIRDGACDLGIVGENILEEQEDNSIFERIKLLGFGRCRLSIALPKEVPFDNLSILQGMRIATSYPNLLQRYLEKNQIDAKIIEITGSVEIAPRLKLADAICDLVATGRTLAENNLKEVHVLLESQAALIKNHKPLLPTKLAIYNQLLQGLNNEN